jgi:exopolysaccharide biosynthesis protein
MPVSSESKPPAEVFSPAPAVQASLQYQKYSLPNSEIYTVTIPPKSRFKLSVAVAEGTETVEQFAQANRVIAVLNGGFFDPKNQKTTSRVVQSGKVVADPNQNERLKSNPDLQPYLEQILNRSEFRRYACGQNDQFAIVTRDAAPPANCKLIDAIAGGPQLLPKLTATEEGFVDEMVGRDSVGVQQRNARSAIGITSNGSIVLVMAAQKPDAPSNSGMSLPALTTFMQERLGVKQAMNLDGGSSSALFYEGKTVYGKVDPEGQPIQRAVKSVILVQE